MVIIKIIYESQLEKICNHNYCVSPFHDHYFVSALLVASSMIQLLDLDLAG